MKRLVVGLTVLSAMGCVAQRTGVTFSSVDRITVGSGVGTQSGIDRRPSPVPGMAYVTGLLSTVEGSAAFSLSVVDALGREYWIEFDERRGVSELPLGLIELPPGDYRLARWSAAGLRPQGLRGAPPPFAVRADHVVFLGRFTARQRIDAGAPAWGRRLIKTTWTIDGARLPADDAWARFRRGFPDFAAVALDCVGCTAPEDAGAQAAAPAPPQDGDFGAAHEIAVHFHRLGQIRDAGLVAWEILAGSGKKRDVNGASRGETLLAWGWDDFGGCWTVNDLNFRNGQVNLSFRSERESVRKPAQWTFSLSQGREVWINEGDPAVYLSLEAAVAAQRTGP